MKTTAFATILWLYATARRVMANDHRRNKHRAEVVARIEQIAKAKKIPLQHEAMSSTSGTDTDVIFWTRGGIASALVSLPNRYMHSPVEVVNLKDLEKLPALYRAVCERLLI